MAEVRTAQLNAIQFIAARLRDYAELSKIRLASLVVFSSVIAFLMAANGNWTWPGLMMLVIGGFMVTAASNALNQVIEKDYDRLMNRTMKRPLPDGRMSVTEALLVAGIFAVGGLCVFLIYFNPLSAILSALALLSYAFIYTPLKRFSSVAVFVGAFPGALPLLIGTVSASGSITALGLILFAIQFIWQFPHFWAIAWVSADDYARAGYYLLPSKEGRTKFSALQTMLYTFVLVPVSLVPAWLGFTGWISAVVILICGVGFFYQSVVLFRECTVSAARKLMFGSFIYLPIVQVALYLDRIV